VGFAEWGAGGCGAGDDVYSTGGGADAAAAVGFDSGSGYGEAGEEGGGRERYTPMLLKTLYH
jgi:hypothetical protein